MLWKLASAHVYTAEGRSAPRWVSVRAESTSPALPIAIGASRKEGGQLAGWRKVRTFSGDATGWLLSWGQMARRILPEAMGRVRDGEQHSALKDQVVQRQHASSGKSNVPFRVCVWSLMLTWHLRRHCKNFYLPPSPRVAQHYEADR